MLDGDVDGLDVIVYLLPVIASFRIEIAFLDERFFDAGLGAFDTAGGGRLLGDVHANEEIDVGDQLRKGVQFAEQAIGFFQEGRNLRIGDAPFMIDGSGKKTSIFILLFVCPGIEPADIHRFLVSKVH